MRILHGKTEVFFTIPCNHLWMDKWLDIPKDRTRLPTGRMCLILALTILMLLALAGRKHAVIADIGLALFGLA